MKRKINIVLCAALSAICFLSGVYGADAKSGALRIAGLKGPTTMGLCNLISENETSRDYEFTIYGSADEAVPHLVRGDLDAVTIPANLAATLYQRTHGQIVVACINTLGVFYITEKGNTIHTPSDLKGKTIFSMGRGITPEYVLRYILSANNLDMDRDVKMEWVSEATEAVSRLELSENTVAMLPEPFVTTAMRRINGLRVALDLNSGWEAAAGTGLVTGVLVVRTDSLKRAPEAFEAFMKGYEKSVASSHSDPKGTAALCARYGIVPNASVAEEALPRCNIVFITGNDMKNALVNYYRVLYDANPASVGGALPDDAFYYGASSSEK